MHSNDQYLWNVYVKHNRKQFILMAMVKPTSIIKWTTSQKRSNEQRRIRTKRKREKKIDMCTENCIPLLWNNWEHNTYLVSKVEIKERENKRDTWWMLAYVKKISMMNKRNRSDQVNNAQIGREIDKERVSERERREGGSERQRRGKANEADYSNNSLLKCVEQI